MDAEYLDYRQCRTRISTNIPEPVGRKLNLAKMEGNLKINKVTNAVMLIAVFFNMDVVHGNRLTFQSLAVSLRTTRFNN